MSSAGRTEPNLRIALREAAYLQATEGNPLDGGQIARFDMFDREGWCDEGRLQHIRDRALRRVAVAAAE